MQDLGLRVSDLCQGVSGFCCKMSTSFRVQDLGLRA